MPRPRSKSSSAARVLLVDEEPGSLASQVRQLAPACDLAFDTTTSIAEAWRLLDGKAEPYDVAIVVEPTPRAAAAGVRGGSLLGSAFRRRAPWGEYLTLHQPVRSATDLLRYAEHAAALAVFRRHHPDLTATAAGVDSFAALAAAYRADGSGLKLLGMLEQPAAAAPPLEAMIEVAVSALRARTGGLYRLSPDDEELRLVAVFNDDQYKGKILRMGEGLCGRLAQDGKPYRIVRDYDRWRHRAYRTGSGFGAVLAVPVQWRGKTLGCLYVNDLVGRVFTRDDAAFLAALALPVALVLASLADRDERNLNDLQRLWRATRAVMKDLEHISLDSRLELIAQQAIEILNAEACGVFLVKAKGQLTLEASVGHREGGFDKGRSIEVHNRPHGGLTGWIAFHREVFNVHGKELKNHLAATSGPRAYHTRSHACYSLLAIPLLRERQGAPGTTDMVGLLRVDNKCDAAGQPRLDLRFSAEDENILNLFAEEVVIALESAQLVRELDAQRRSMKLLVESSPLGIISIDRSSEVKVFNRTAQNVLGYPSEEAIGQPVKKFYLDETMPTQIGRQLHEGRGSLRGYDSAVKHRDGHGIPIRISATWLFDAHGERDGSAGYFEDLNAIRLHEARKEVLAQASNLVLGAHRLEEGLSKLAQLLIGQLQHTFCRILLMGDDPAFLQVEAAIYPCAPPPVKAWRPGKGTHVAVADWPHLARVIGGERPETIRRREGPEQAKLLQRLTRRLHLGAGIQSLLLVPCRTDRRVVALLEVGELESEAHRPFTAGEQEIAAAIAAHTALLIDRRRLERATEEQNAGLQSLQQAIESLASQEEPAALLAAVAASAARMIGAAAALVWPYDAETKTFLDGELTAHELPAAVTAAFRRREAQSDGSAKLTLASSWHRVPDLRSREARGRSRRLLLRAGLRGLQAVALVTGGERVGVLYLFHAQPLGRAEEHRWLLERYASSAASFLKRARLREQISRANLLANAIAELMRLNPVGTILERVPTITCTGLGCQAVTLFPYDPATAALTRPYHAGVFDPANLDGWQDLGKSRLIRSILRLQDPLFIEDVSTHELTRSSIFAHRERIVACAAVPLLSGGSTVGVVFANYRSAHHFSKQEIASIQWFATQAGIAIGNAQLYGEVLRTQEALNAFYRASQAINTKPNLPAILKEVVKQAQTIAQARQAGRCEGYVVLSDSGNLSVIAATSDELFGKLQAWTLKHAAAVSGGGIVNRVVRTGESANVGDVHADPDYRPLLPWTASQLTVAMRDGEEIIGALTIEHEARDAFSWEEDNFKTLATQAAAAIQSAWRLKGLQALHVAAATVSKAEQPATVGQAIVDQAQRLFGASAAVLWPYDAKRGQFLLDGPAAAGLNPRDLEVAKRIQPGPESLRFAVLQEGWIPIPDLSTPPPSVGLRAAALAALRRTRTRSLQAVRLTAGGEAVGVLYLGYAFPRKFTDRHRKELENFATYAALSLKQAWLAEQARRQEAISQILDRVSAVDDPNDRVRTVLHLAPRAAGATTVRLYLRDPLRRTFEVCYLAGGRRQSQLMRAVVSDTGILRRLLRQRRVAGSASAAEAGTFLLLDRSVRRRVAAAWPMAADRRLPAWIALPLVAEPRRIGVLFLGYGAAQHFRADQLAALTLLANQTAVAIANNFLYQEAQHRADRLDALSRAGRAVTQSLSVEATLQTIADHALLIAGGDAQAAGTRAYAALIEGEGASLASSPAAPAAAVPLLKEVREIGRGKRGVAVPVRFGHRTIGLIAVESAGQSELPAGDLSYMKLLAAQAAVALENARRYRQLRHTQGLVGPRTVLAWTGLISSVWRHDIESKAVAIRKLTEVIAPYLIQAKGPAAAVLDRAALIQNLASTSDRAAALIDKVAKIHDLADKILARPIVPPLATEASKASLRIDEMVTDWTTQLWRNPPYTAIRKELVPQLGARGTTYASAEWLRRAFEYLMENAAKAVEAQSHRQIKISTSREGQTAYVDIDDNGRGIPPRVLKRLFREPIRAGRSGGSGVGLLLAEVIAQAYDGDVSLLCTGGGGTIMRLSLRLE
jgi:PAS domain S-box-containing protein